MSGREKHEKELKRKRDKERQKKHQAELARLKAKRDLYPEIVVDESNGYKPFVEEVKRAVSRIDFESFGTSEKTMYQMIRKEGAETAWSELKRQAQAEQDKGNTYAATMLYYYSLHFQIQLYDAFPQDKRKTYMPYSIVRQSYSDNKIVLTCSSMHCEAGENGTIYYGTLKPKVVFHGNEYIASFSRHAVDRICERVAPQYFMAAHAAKAHAIFNKCRYYEPLVLPNGDQAFKVYCRCDEKIFATYKKYFEYINPGAKPSSEDRTYFIAGYCPVVFEKSYAKAKTFLFPGYLGTPEFDLLDKSNLRQKDKASFKRLARNLNITQVLESDSIELIKWFHENGIPQVLHISQTVYEDA